MNKSESIKELATALDKAQAEMTNPRFDSMNPHFKSKYASLASVRNAVVPILAKNGLSVMQHLTTTEKGVKCGVILMHSSGEWREFDPMEIPATKPDAQGFVSAATYAKRTTLQAIACVVGDEDDDGNAASGKQGYTVQPEDVPTGDPAILATLTGAKTMEELSAAWNKIPVGVRRSYTAAKDAAKERIGKATS